MDASESLDIFVGICVSPYFGSGILTLEATRSTTSCVIILDYHREDETIIPTYYFTLLREEELKSNRLSILSKKFCFIQISATMLTRYLTQTIFRILIVSYFNKRGSYFPIKKNLIYF